MKVRSALALLAAGLVVGAGAGFMVGRQGPGSGPQPQPETTTPGPAVTSPEVAAQSAAVPETAVSVATYTKPSLYSSRRYQTYSGRRADFTTPAGLSKGMTKAKALEVLWSKSFERWKEPSDPDGLERFRKRWHGGYHYVNLRFGGDQVTECDEMFIDP